MGQNSCALEALGGRQPPKNRNTVADEHRPEAHDALRVTHKITALATRLPVKHPA